MSSNFDTALIPVDTSSVDYSKLAQISDPASPEFQRELAIVQAAERAAGKADQSRLKGTGAAGHKPYFAEIKSGEARAGSEFTTPGAMQQGVASPNLTTDTVTIAGMTTSLEVGEAMRRDMTPAQWKAATGLEYTSLTIDNFAGQDRDTDAKQARAQAELDKVQEQITQADAAQAKADEDADAARIAQEQALVSVPQSALETVVDQHLGRDVLESVRKVSLDSGEVPVEDLTKHGITQDMVDEAVTWHRSAAEDMLDTVNSSLAYVENGLSDAEQKRMRHAVVSRDLTTVQALGEVARNRIAGMRYNDVANFLTPDEQRMVNLTKRGNETLVTIEGRETSWANAVTSKLLTFRG